MDFPVLIPVTLVYVGAVGRPVCTLPAAGVAAVYKALVCGYGIALGGYRVVRQPPAVAAFAAFFSHSGQSFQPWSYLTVRMKCKSYTSLFDVYHLYRTYLEYFLHHLLVVLRPNTVMVYNVTNNINMKWWLTMEKHFKK
jgi:hypothetical protein